LNVEKGTCEICQNCDCEIPTKDLQTNALSNYLQLAMPSDI